MTATRPRLLLVDDHDVVRVGTRALLDERFDVVGEADNVDSAIELAFEREPDIVLLDVRLPGGGGAAVIGEIRKTMPEMCIVAFTVSTSRLDVVRMMNAGVDGYLTKATHSEDLADLLESALAGNKPVSKEVAGYLLDIDDEIDTGTGIERLTPREREVVNLIARGYTYRETADRLDIKVKTLETHMGHIFKKLGIASRYELTALVGPTFLRPDDD
jgi:DNA-binding NarL/FixJ family response regulator